MQTMWTWLGWLRNEVDFPLRSALRLRRRGARLPAEAKEGLFAPDSLPEVDRLVTTYGLERWGQVSGRVDFAASLFYLQMLERALREAEVTLPDQVAALDAGCGDWFYVQALYGLLQRFGARQPREVTLYGVEVDAYQPYQGLHARIDWAEAYAGGLEGARYLPQDLRSFREPVDIAFLLFPFLFSTDLRRWGLPRRYLRPAQLLAHVWDRVRPGGVLVAANLGDAERQEQHRLLREAGREIVWWGRHASPLFAYRQDRFVTVVR